MRWIAGTVVLLIPSLAWANHPAGEGIVFVVAPVVAVLFAGWWSFFSRWKPRAGWKKGLHFVGMTLALSYAVGVVALIVLSL
jgi:hypothetical protein